MTETPSHEAVEQLLAAAAMEILEGDELLRVTAHVRECSECARLLDSYREATAGLATGLTARRLQPAQSARLRARLLARTGRTASVAPKSKTPARRSSGAVDRWSGWAVAAGLAGLLLIHHSFHRPVAYGWLLAGVLTLLLLALGVYTRVQRARISALEDRLERKEAVDPAGNREIRDS